MRAVRKIETRTPFCILLIVHDVTDFFKKRRQNHLVSEKSDEVGSIAWMPNNCRLNKQRGLVEAYRLPWFLEQSISVSLNLAKVVCIAKSTVIEHTTHFHIIFTTFGCARSSWGISTHKRNGGLVNHNPVWPSFSPLMLHCVRRKEGQSSHD